MKKVNLLILAFLFFLFSMNSYSQSSQIGYLDVSINSESGLIQTSFEYNPQVFANLTQPFHRTLGRSFWKIGNSNCQWRNITSQIVSPNLVKVSADSVCPEKKSDYYYDLKFLSNMDPAFKIIARIFTDKDESTFLFSSRNREIKIRPKMYSFGRVVFMRIGFCLILFIPILIFLKRYTLYYQPIIRNSVIGIMILSGYCLLNAFYFKGFWPID